MSDPDLVGYPEVDAVRDAIHVAILPVIAGDDIDVSDFVRWDGEHAYPCERSEAIGIANPFFKNDRRNRKIKKFERFYIFVFPRTVTGMIHHWSLPAVDNVIKATEEKKLQADNVSLRQKSEEWLRHFCSYADCPSYDDMIEQLNNCDEDDTHRDYFTVYGDAHGEIPAEFWVHAEIVTGRKFGRPTYFSCSC